MKKIRNIIGVFLPKTNEWKLLENDKKYCNVIDLMNEHFLKHNNRNFIIDIERGVIVTVISIKESN